VPTTSGDVMQPRVTGWPRRCFLVLGLLAFAAYVVGTGAAQPPGRGEPGTAIQPRASGSATTPARTAQKKVKFEMRDKPWRDVLEWLADISGLQVIATIKPTGTLTFIAPRNGP